MENYKISDPVEYQIESRKIFLKNVFILITLII